MVSTFLFSPLAPTYPTLGNDPIGYCNVFQMAWNQQPDQFLSCRCPFHLHRCLFEAWKMISVPQTIAVLHPIISAESSWQIGMATKHHATQTTSNSTQEGCHLSRTGQLTWDNPCFAPHVELTNVQPKGKRGKGWERPWSQPLTRKNYGSITATQKNPRGWKTHKKEAQTHPKQSYKTLWKLSFDDGHWSSRGLLIWVGWWTTPSCECIEMLVDGSVGEVFPPGIFDDFFQLQTLEFHGFSKKGAQNVRNLEHEGNMFERQFESCFFFWWVSSWKLNTSFPTDIQLLGFWVSLWDFFHLIFFAPQKLEEEAEVFPLCTNLARSRCLLFKWITYCLPWAASICC